MSGVFLSKPPYCVDVGPKPGVYASREAYEATLEREGFTQIIRAFHKPEIGPPIPGLDPWQDEGGG